jgi:hypothetical protein
MRHCLGIVGVAHQLWVSVTSDIAGFNTKVGVLKNLDDLCSGVELPPGRPVNP